MGPFDSVFSQMTGPINAIESQVINTGANSITSGFSSILNNSSPSNSQLTAESLATVTGSPLSTVTNQLNGFMPQWQDNLNYPSSLYSLVGGGFGGVGSMDSVMQSVSGGSLDPSMFQSVSGGGRGSNGNTTQFRVCLSSSVNPQDIVTFQASPMLNENGQVGYDQLSPVHHPGTIQIYKTTMARSFTLTAQLITRTAAEADCNIKIMNMIRSWRMPYYGTGTASSSGSRLGAPPDVLYLNAYGQGNLMGIPVVLTSYDLQYNNECDYLPSSSGAPFPAIAELTVSLVEAYSPREFSSFNITAYKSGNLAGAFSAGQGGKPSPSQGVCAAMQSSGGMSDPYGMDNSAFSDAFNNMSPDNPNFFGSSYGLDNSSPTTGTGGFVVDNGSTIVDQYAELQPSNSSISDLLAPPNEPTSMSFA